MEYCDCLGVRGFRDGVKDIWDEVQEWVEEPSMDELSDVMFGIGRLVAGVFGKVYVHVPGDGKHVEKINERMVKQGCVRGERKVAAGEGCK